MPRPRLQKQIVPVPLTSGLSQREDPAWLQPGQAIQITNYIKGKQSTLERPLGYSAIGLKPTAGANIAYVGAVATHKTTPIVVATDTAYGPGIYAYSDNDNALTLIDRVSEVFVPTPQTVVAYQQPIQELDVAVISPLGLPTAVLHIWTLDPASSGVFRVYYMVRDYKTNAVIVPAQEVTTLASVSTTSSMVAPKIVACMNGGVTNACVLVVGVASTNSLYAVPFSPNTLTWGAASQFVTDIQTEAVFDAAAVDDDSTRFVVAYENSSARHLTVSNFNSSTLALVATGTFSDTTWSSGTDHITGFACRASVASGGMWLAYAWAHVSNATNPPSTQPFIHGGGQAYPALSSSVCTAVDLTNSLTSQYPGPRLLDIKEVDLATNTQCVVWSPPSTKVGFDPAYIGTPSASHPPPLTAIYQSAFFPSSGTGTLKSQQPRWTNGVTLASRLYPYQLAKNLGNANANNATQAFVVGFMPSNNLNPTWSGVNTVATPNVTAVTNVAYPPYLTFGGPPPFGGANGRTYGVTTSGGTQAEALMGPGSPTPASYTASNAFGSPGGANISNINVSEPGSGYTAAPFAQLNWGVGSVLVPLFANAHTGGSLTGIRVLDTTNVSGTANQTVSGGNVTLSLNAAFGVTPTLAGATLTITGAANAANNNGTFAILAVTGGLDVVNGLYSNVLIKNPIAVNENGMTYTINNFNGGGLNYDMQPNTVPVYVQDVVNNIVYTEMAEAIVQTQAGPNIGSISSVFLTGVSSNVTFTGGGVGSVFNPNVHVWVPQPNTPAPQFSFANGNANAVSLGAYAQVSTTLVSSTPYENIQGSFYLFSMDTFADFSTPNDVGTPYRNTPMRLVAELKPRLALNSIMSTAHTLPHWGQSWPNGLPSAAWGPSVFDLPINVSPTSVGITQFQPEIFPAWVLESTMYQGDELGGLTAMSAGEPVLTDGARMSGFSYSYSPENVYAWTVGPQGPGLGGFLYPGSSYQWIATYERMDTVGNTHRSGRSVPVTFVTLPTYDDSRYSVKLAIPTIGFGPSTHGSNQTNLANVATQTPTLIQLYRTSNPGATTGGFATTGGTVFFNLSATSAGVAQNDLWSPYVVFADGTVTGQSDGAISTNPLCYGDGSNGVDPGSNIDTLCPPALQGIIVHKNRFWGFEGSNVWYTKAFTSGEGPGFNEQFAFSVDDGSGDITALASMDERLLIFKRDRIFYVVGDGPNDNLSSNDLQPPQRIQSDVGAIGQASIVVAPSGVYFLSDDGLYQVTRKFEVAHYGSFVDDWITQYPVITSSALDQVNGRLVWVASKIGPGLMPGAIIVIYSYLWDAWTIEQLDEGGGNYGNFQVSSVKMTGATPTITIGGNYANTGGPFVLRESTSTSSTYTVPNSAGAATYQQAVWQSPWLKAQDFQGFARWSLVSLSWYNCDSNQLQVQLDYNYSSSYTQTFTISAAAMLKAQKAGVPNPIVQWEEQPNFPKAESMRITITDMKDSVSAPISGHGSTLLALSVTMALKDGTRTYPVPVTQRGSA